MTGRNKRISNDTTTMSNTKRKIIQWLISKLVGYNPFKELRAASEFYANRQYHRLYPRRRQGKHWSSIFGDEDLGTEYLAYLFSFTDGYIKCLDDHGLMFEEGKIINKIESYS